MHQQLLCHSFYLHLKARRTHQSRIVKFFQEIWARLTCQAVTKDLERQEIICGFASTDQSFSHKLFKTYVIACFGLFRLAWSSSQVISFLSETPHGKSVHSFDEIESDPAIRWFGAMFHDIRLSGYWRKVAVDSKVCWHALLIVFHGTSGFKWSNRTVRPYKDNDGHRELNRKVQDFNRYANISLAFDGNVQHRGLIK